MPTKSAIRYRRWMKKKRTAKRKAARKAAAKSKPYRLLKSGFPASQVVKHKYLQYLTLDSDGLTTAFNKFRANSVYDPDFTGTGGQPMNHDLYASLYDHYVVLGAKITVTAYSQTSLGGSPAVLYIDVLDSSTASATGYIEAMERRRCRSIVLPTRETNRNNRLSNWFSSKKFFGVTDVDDNRDNLGSVKLGNPSEQCLFEVGVMPMDGVTNIDPVNCLVQIDYIVKWSEPIPQSRS